MCVDVKHHEKSEEHFAVFCGKDTAEVNKLLGPVLGIGGSAMLALQAFPW